MTTITATDYIIFFTTLLTTHRRQITKIVKFSGYDTLQIIIIYNALRLPASIQVFKVFDPLYSALALDLIFQTTPSLPTY